MWPHPIEIPFIGIVLRPTALMLFLCGVFYFTVGPRWAESLEGGNRWRHRLVFPLALVAVFAGARAHFLINHWDALGDSTKAWALWAGGFHAGGGVAAAALVTPLILRALRVPIGKFADAVMPTVGIAIAIARLGCFLQGCCFGTVCTLPWCIPFPREGFVFTYHRWNGYVNEEALHSAAIHPLQLYFAAGGLLITVVALWLHPRKRYDGQVALVGLVVYGISAAVLEFFRENYSPRNYWGPLPQLEWTALGITALALVALSVAEWTHRGKAGAVDPAGPVERT